MNLPLSLFFYILTTAYAQNLSTNVPNPTPHMTQTTLPTTGSPPTTPIVIQMSANNASVPTFSSQFTESEPNTTGTIVEPSPVSCPNGYRCYPRVFCENPLPVSNETRNPEEFCSMEFEICCGASQSPTSPTTILPKLQCGIRNKRGQGFRITGEIESESQFGEFPWMAIILVKNFTEKGTPVNLYQAGGSLIHPLVVLTVAHRVAGLQTNVLRVRLGEWDTETTAEIFPFQDRDVGQVLIHNDFDSGTLKNDIALVFLTAPAELNDIVQPVCLPPPDAVFEQSNCIATGWGKDVYGKTGVHNTVLKKVELPIISAAECQSLLRETRLSKYFELHDSFVCAGGKAGEDTCNGDGGSPLACPVGQSTKDQYYQVGIVAWGIGCGDNKTPAVYTNVAKFRKWIDDTIVEKGLTIDSYSV